MGTCFFEYKPEPLMLAKLSGMGDRSAMHRGHQSVELT